MLLAVLAAVVLGAPWMAAAGEGAGERAGCNCIFCQAKESQQKALPWLKLFGDARLREISAPNLLCDQEDRHFQRYRFRLGATVTPIENLDFNVRAVYEPRHYCQPGRDLQVRNQFFIDEWTNNEIIFDQMNVTWSKAFGLPLRFVVGRQDIILGNGWLVLDGTPLDGSRTIFFDAARATWDIEAAKTTVDVTYICQHADSDYWLPPINDKDFHNHEQDEQGVIVYVTNKSLPKTQVDGYFIYKHDEPDLGTVAGDVRGGHLAPWQQGARADIYTFGARAVHDLTDNVSLRGEFAQQFGSKALWGDERRELCAFGFNSLATYKFNDKCKNEVHAGYEFLSGDKSSTRGKDEQFDPLWGRWPQWSELYVYPVGLENRPGETTNLHRVNLGWSCVPSEKITVGADYHLLFAQHNSYPLRSDGGPAALRYFDDDGNCRGHLLVGKMTYQFAPHISGHFLAELFFPGNFYDDAYNEVAGFLRYELTLTW
jgi:hypothetical protein